MGEIRKYFKLNDNENTTNPSIWEAAKAGLWGKLIVLNLYIRKGGASSLKR
jgi:hypothetical protein